MHECAEFTLLARFLSAAELLAWVSFILVRVVQPFERGVGELAIFRAPSSVVWVVVLALLRHIEEFVRRPSMIERLVSVNTVIPVVVFGLVSAVCSFISVYVENDRVYRL